MNEKYAFYFEHNNKLFNSDVLVCCCKFSPEEQCKYNFTSDNVLIFIKHKNLIIDKYKDVKNIDYVNIIRSIFKNEKIMLRVQCECLLGMYGDSHCDCEDQRLEAIQTISENNGIYIHIPQEAQGWGLHYKLKELELQLSGRLQNGDYVGAKTRDEAQKILTHGECFKDVRSFSFLTEIFEFLKIKDLSFILLSNSNKKVEELQSIGLKIELLKKEKELLINDDNLSEYLIKILNNSHKFSDEVMNAILEKVSEGDCNQRSLSSFLEIIAKIKNNEELIFDEKYKEKFLSVYSDLICGSEKSYFIGENGTHKVQNHFSCQVAPSIFKTLKKIFNKNIFDRVSLERLYYFKNKKINEMVKIRTSEVLKIKDNSSPFFEGQHHAEERIVDYDKNTTIQNDVSKTRLKVYVENKDYDFVKQVEMLTIISEYELDGVKVFIKRIPMLDYRVMDIFAKKNKIIDLLEQILKLDKGAVLSTITNKNYQDENFTRYNLRFADLAGVTEEELTIFNLLGE